MRVRHHSALKHVTCKVIVITHDLRKEADTYDYFARKLYPLIPFFERWCRFYKALECDPNHTSFDSWKDLFVLT